MPPSRLCQSMACFIRAPVTQHSNQRLLPIMCRATTTFSVSANWIPFIGSFVRTFYAVRMRRILYGASQVKCFLPFLWKVVAKVEQNIIKTDIELRCKFATNWCSSQMNCQSRNELNSWIIALYKCVLYIVFLWILKAKTYLRIIARVYAMRIVHAPHAIRNVHEICAPMCALNQQIQMSQSTNIEFDIVDDTLNTNDFYTNHGLKNSSYFRLIKIMP